MCLKKRDLKKCTKMHVLQFKVVIVLCRCFHWSGITQPHSWWTCTSTVNTSAKLSQDITVFSKCD